ncbi:vacuolar membrane-associated protein iml1, partial [Coemansia nantahalensis]
MLRVHEEAFSKSDLVVNPAFFPGVCVGDIVAIKPVSEGDKREAVSPRGSLDGDPAAAAAAVSAAGVVAAASSSGTAPTDSSDGHAGNSSSSAKTKSLTTSVSKPSPLAAGTGQSVAVSETSSEAAGSADRARQSLPSPRAANGPTGGPASGAANSRAGKADSGSAEDDDDSAGGLAPDPHREILLRVGELRRDTQQIQASISIHAVQALWGDSGEIQRVAVRKVDLQNVEEREAIRADFVEIAFRDQYVGRSDMWRLWRKLSQRVVHNNKPTNIEGLIRASVRRIYKDSQEIACGFIDAATQPIFRSESGRFIILLQMSEEMWAFHEDGHLCFEKAVNGFLAGLFRRWSKRQLNHMVTIVMFSRWYYHGRDGLFFPDLMYDKETGRYYRDYYKVISDMEARPDWTVFLPELLAEFNAYRRDIQELRTSAGSRLRGDLSKANQGNILEAINLGLNSFASNYVDRDLSRTGMSTIVVTPSFGVFDVSKKLLRLTTERMLNVGVRVDFVCLAPPPLFRPPVFRFMSCPVPSEQEQLRARSLKEQAEQDAKRANESKLSSVSPLAESAGAHPHAGPHGLGAVATPKDRPAKIGPKPDGVLSAIDPIMLDPLYFDDESWECELLPYLTGDVPPAARDSWASRWSGAGSGDARSDAAELRALRKKLESSIANALVGSIPGFDPAEVPKTILDLSKDDHPCFTGAQRTPRAENRVMYEYFAYWVDSGFYNFADDRRNRHPGGFVPSCKMGDLSVAGVDSYMRCTPRIPSLDLRARDYGHLAAAAGCDTYTGSMSACSLGDPSHSRPEVGWPQDAQIAAAATDVVHGMILRADRLATLEGRESLLAMFAAFDSGAIVSAGSDPSTGPSAVEGTGSGSIWAGAGPLGTAAEPRTTYGHIPTPQHLTQNAASTRGPEPRSAATERAEAGPSRSAERMDPHLPA